MNRFWSCLLVTLTSIPAAAQNVDALSDPWTHDAAYRSVLLGTAPLQHIVLWPAPLATLSPGEQPPYAAWLTDSVSGVRFLPRIGRHLYVVSAADKSARLLGNVSIMGRTGYVRSGDSSDGFFLGRLGAQAFFRYGEHVEGFLDMSNGIRFAGPPEAAISVDPSLGRILKFTIEARRYFDRYTGYIQLRWGSARLRFGREPLSLGYSPIDNLILSPQAPPLDGLLLELRHGSLRFTYLHAAAEGTDTAGAPVPSKFVALHRLGWEPLPQVSIAAYDMVVYSGRGLDLAYLNPLAFFVSAGLQTAERSNRDNSLLALEAAVRPWHRVLLYGTLLVDDLNFSTLFDTTVAGNTNKFAFQLGTAVLLPLGSLGVRVAAEYVRIGPFVFSHRTIVNSWTHLNTPLGYDMQPNSDRWALQVRYWLAPRFWLNLGADYTRHGENLLGTDGRLLVNVGGDILRGDGDVLTPNRFLRGNRSDTRRITFQLAAEWLPNVMSFVSLGYLNRTGGNSPLRRGWAALEVRLGY